MLDTAEVVVRWIDTLIGFLLPSASKPWLPLVSRFDPAIRSGPTHIVTPRGEHPPASRFWRMKAKPQSFRPIARTSRTVNHTAAQ